jgi:tetratricopeptide (TPR) repeat protein
VALATIAVLIASAGALHGVMKERLARPPIDELLYYPSGLLVRQASLGYESAAADAAWLRGIQYYGEHRLTDQKYEMIGHVMSIVTDLDPRFLQPYIFGGLVLAQELKRTDEGLALLEKGLRANPDSWLLAFETGFIHYVCRHDYEAAARYFVRASRLPNHPEYVDRFAAFASQKSGNAGMAILLWKRVLATGNKYMQDVAQRELTRLDAEKGAR